MSNPKDLVGAKKAPLRYVPPAGAIESSGPHEDGAIKYGPFNWRETPVEMVTYLEAIDRHLAALKDGQDVAEDSGYSHIGHIIAGANIIADAKAHGTLIDNRFAKGPAADMLRARDKSTTAGFTRCPLCSDVERTEDIVGGVCLTCADGIAFSQNARRVAIAVPAFDILPPQFVKDVPEGYCPDCGQPILSHSHLITCPAYGS